MSTIKPRKLLSTAAQTTLFKLAAEWKSEVSANPLSVVELQRVKYITEESKETCYPRAKIKESYYDGNKAYDPYFDSVPANGTYLDMICDFIDNRPDLLWCNGPEGSDDPILGKLNQRSPNLWHKVVLKVWSLEEIPGYGRIYHTSLAFGDWWTRFSYVKPKAFRMGTATESRGFDRCNGANLFSLNNISDNDFYINIRSDQLEEANLVTGISKWSRVPKYHLKSVEVQDDDDEEIRNCGGNRYGNRIGPECFNDKPTEEGEPVFLGQKTFYFNATGAELKTIVHNYIKQMYDNSHSEYSWRYNNCQTFAGYVLNELNSSRVVGSDTGLTLLDLVDKETNQPERLDVSLAFPKAVVVDRVNPMEEVTNLAWVRAKQFNRLFAQLRNIQGGPSEADIESALESEDSKRELARLSEASRRVIGWLCWIYDRLRESVGDEEDDPGFPCV